MSTLDIVTAQSASIEPEEFQRRLIAGMSSALLRRPAPPCLLRAPTGSGKTYMIARVLEEVSAARPTLWLWFVPFVNLLQQTEDALAANCQSLSPALLVQGRNQEAKAGMVLLSTAAGVGRAKDRKAGYDADGDDAVRTLAAFIARARVQGLALGVVVDEAHIGLDRTTEFGQFVHWLEADFLIMATATPKDERLLAFLREAGMSAFESFAASRDEVVEARLNKRYIEAVVYDLRQSVQTVADLKRTVLKQAWRRHCRLKRQLQEAGIALTPLLLVQVANGEKSVEEAEHDLVHLCKVHPGLIGKHSSNDPDPVLMAAIANDSSKEVLIFKQSAGTGFDAPRAFVLASTKPVNDADFAMQFIGRVMRVARALREHYARPRRIPADFDTAFIYLADADAQRGFEAAVQASSAVKSQLEGQTEKLIVRHTLSGAAVLTNRETVQAPLLYELPLPEAPRTPAPHRAEQLLPTSGPQGSLFDAPPAGEEVAADGLDAIAPATKSLRPLPANPPASADEWRAALHERGIRVYPRRPNLPQLPAALQREQRPQCADMAKVSEAVASRLPLADDLQRNAVRAALSRLKEKEVHTELNSGKRHEEDVLVITDRAALAREAVAALRRLPQVEDEDVRIIVDVLARRLRERIDEEFDAVDDEQRPGESELRRYARDAAYWVIRREAVAIAELLQGTVAEFTTQEEASPLPDWMLFPAALSLAASRRNIYGVLPPADEDLAQIEQLLMVDERAWLADRRIDDGLQLARFDGASKLNREERDFARALDHADFVEWWHRNPDRKPWSVRLVRGEHQNYFYPDFVVCLSHYPGDAPLLRLVETKENVKDAQRKAQRVPRRWGKVLFLTRDQERLRVINDDGSQGATIDYDDLTPMREWLRATRPV